MNAWSWWHWLKDRLVRIAFQDPRGVALLFFLFLYTVSNYVYSAGMWVLPVPSYWHMLLIGSVMATLGSVLLFEVIRAQRKLSQVLTVRTVASTLQNEINNPLMIIQLLTEKLKAQQAYDAQAMDQVLSQCAAIRDAMGRLSTLDADVRRRAEAGLEEILKTQ